MQLCIVFYWLHKCDENNVTGKNDGHCKLYSALSLQVIRMDALALCEMCISIALYSSNVQHKIIFEQTSSKIDALAQYTLYNWPTNVFHIKFNINLFLIFY